MPPDLPPLRPQTHFPPNAQNLPGVRENDRGTFLSTSEKKLETSWGQIGQQVGASWGEILELVPRRLGNGWPPPLASRGSAAASKSLDLVIRGAQLDPVRIPKEPKIEPKARCRESLRVF